MQGPSGWKRRMEATRSRIVAAALDLFERHGYDEVTVADIAEASGVGERTVYRYFSSKELIVLEDQPGGSAAFIAALGEAPPELDVAEAIGRTYRRLAEAQGEHATDTRRHTLILDTPALHSAWISALAAAETPMRGWLATRTGRTVDDEEVGLVAAVLMAAHRHLTEVWDGTDLEAHLVRTDRALRRLRDGSPLLAERGRRAQELQQEPSPTLPPGHRVERSVPPAPDS